MVFDSTRCQQDLCNSHAWGDSGYCHSHHPDPDSYISRMHQELSDSEDAIIDSRDFSYMDFSGMDLKRREFRYCRFSSAVFTDADLSGCRFAMCLLDGVTADKTLFQDIRMMSVMAAGSDFSRSDFTGSDLVNVNFIGIRAEGAVFDESDLFYSRFIRANLKEAKFRDCNLKSVDFSNAIAPGADFSDSNPEEAYFTAGASE